MIPVHNANGYQGVIYQFLWRSEMDYHQLLNEQQPMQQPTTTDYAAQLSAVKTLPELFDFRAKLKAERDAFSAAWYDEGAKANSKHLKDRHEAQFFIDRVESQIKSLENSGVFLAAVDGRGVVGVLELASDPVPGVLELSPIEQKAKEKGPIQKLRELQSIADESEWVFADGTFAPLYDNGIAARLSIAGKPEYAYMWLHNMDYETFFQIKNPPKN